MTTRRAFLERFTAAGLVAPLAGWSVFRSEPVDAAALAGAAQAGGWEIDAARREQLAPAVEQLRQGYDLVRALHMPNAVAPALRFDPFAGVAAHTSPPTDVPAEAWIQPASRPSGDADLAFASVATLSHLIRSRQISSVELTRFFLDRLERYNDQLKATVSLLTERALAEAEEADRELAAGRWRGPLHGIPYGAKDLLATVGAKTTWGTPPYQDQTFDFDAAAVVKMREAGAVLVAKLTLGELAWGDVWFGGRTNNPWNIEEGASGSSAGPGSAVAAGLVPFAIGSETLGSIVSPSTRNGVTGLRPTFGRISRFGAMTLSWSMDKLGPMTRSALDAALMFDALHGEDPRDAGTRTVPFGFSPERGLEGLRIGYIPERFEANYRNAAADRAVLDVLRGLGVTFIPVEWPMDIPAGTLTGMLQVEAAAAFDELVRGSGMDAMVRQSPDSWPQVLRAARFVPAVEYLQMARARTLLMAQVSEVFQQIDVLVTPSFSPGILQATNLTGNPCVVVPNAFHPVDGQPERRSPGSISFIADLDRDDAALRVAHAFQQATDWHLQRPPVGR